MSKIVFVGLSGGVDSSVAAALLLEQGYEVHGVFMKNWSKAIGGVECPWREDYEDAKRVAVALDIPFDMYDFEDDYFSTVVSYMLEAFKSGITPNPDIMCNQEIKFKLFYDTARQNGADAIAMGHYAQTSDGRLFRSVDENKDQTYFLYRIPQNALKSSLFPIGAYTKPEIRRKASEYGLPTATKKESMGICFVGRVGIKEFLTEFIEDKPQPGPIVDQRGVTIGEHDGALFYTIGQRTGLGVGGGLPYYVTSKDMPSNTVYVTNDLSDQSLWSSTISLTSVCWINEGPVVTKPEQYTVRTRHRAPLQAISKFGQGLNGSFTIEVNEPIRALTPGQSAVVYHGTECLGGGIVSHI
jgi:tRNA-uridine 2-sulfurtransferase